MRGDPRPLIVNADPSSNSPVGERQKRKGRKPLGSGPENLIDCQVYGPEILAAKTTKRISTQQVIIWFVYHESRLAVNVVGKYTSI
jgi:hypothetical protein